MQTRILITGASGSGTTTLGRSIALHLGCAFYDADDYYWVPTEPPFRCKQAPAVRAARLLQALQDAPIAVLAKDYALLEDRL